MSCHAKVDVQLIIAVVVIYEISKKLGSPYLSFTCGKTPKPIAKHKPEKGLLYLKYLEKINSIYWWPAINASLTWYSKQIMGQVQLIATATLPLTSQFVSLLLLFEAFNDRPSLDKVDSEEEFDFKTEVRICSII